MKEKIVIDIITDFYSGPDHQELQIPDEYREEFWQWF